MEGLKKNWMTRAAMGLALIGATFLAACGSGGGGGGGVTTGTTKVRLINASVDLGTIDLTVGGTKVNSSGVAFGTASAFGAGTTSSAGTTVNVLTAGTSTPIVSLSPSLSNDSFYSVIPYSAAGQTGIRLLQETEVAPAAGSSKLMVMNLAPDAGSLNVYVTGLTDTLDNLSPFSGAAIAPSRDSGYQTLTKGTYRIRVTGADKSDVRFDTNASAPTGVLLDDTKIQTLVLTSTTGGVLVSGLMVAQQGDVKPMINTKSRVRVVSTVPAVSGTPATVVAALGTQTLNAVSGTLPGIGTYTQVAQTGSFSVKVNGADASVVGLPTIAQGADYTLLVWGDAAAPKVTLITDDNRLAADSTKARIRVVNGVADVGAQLSLWYLSSQPVTNVVAGTASSYVNVTPNDKPLIELAAVSGGNIYSRSDFPIVAGGVYTLFAAGSAPGSARLLQER